MHKIAIANQKGGVCKTTITVNLAHELKKKGHRVLVIDTDPQGHVQRSLNLKPNCFLNELLVDQLSSESCIITHEGIDFICGNKMSSAAEIIMQSYPAREKTLHIRMRGSDSKYDFVLVDCSPTLSLLNQNAIFYADSVLIPCTLDDLSIAGLKAVYEQVSTCKEFFDKETGILGIIPTLFDSRLQVTKLYYDYLVNNLGQNLIFSPLRRDTNAQKASGQHQFISDYAPESKIAEDFAKLAEEITERTANKQLGKTTHKEAAERVQELGR